MCLLGCIWAAASSNMCPPILVPVLLTAIAVSHSRSLPFPIIPEQNCRHNDDFTGISLETFSLPSPAELCCMPLQEKKGGLKGGRDGGYVA